MRDTVLIGTFVNDTVKPLKVVKEIFSLFGIRRMFVFEVKEQIENNLEKKWLITFNISKDEKHHKLYEFKEKFKNTLQLHRNKDYNTLYTINSLNKIVKEQNEGKIDNNFKVNWGVYKNTCLLLNKEDELRILPTKLETIFDFPEFTTETN